MSGAGPHTNEENDMPSTQHQPHTPPTVTVDPIRERELGEHIGPVEVHSTGLDVAVKLSPAQFDRLVDALRLKGPGW